MTEQAKMKSEDMVQFFSKLGAKDPEQWARSELEEGIPQRARFLFLRQAWKLVVDEADDTWIEKAIAQSKSRPHRPGAAIGPALERLIADGVSREDITAVIRVKQWELLAGLCYLLEDPGDVEPEAQDIVWQLFQLDEENRPIAAISGLHESVLETDPTGREMRPKQDGGPPERTSR
jgi:hypothetical protein